MTFVDKDDTRIYSVQKDRVDQKIFYNCGDRNFSFAINGYFNGPNYELKPMLKEMMPDDYYFQLAGQTMNEAFTAAFNFS